MMLCFKCYEFIFYLVYCLLLFCVLFPLFFIENLTLDSLLTALSSFLTFLCY
ncbi:hypothetical protein PROVRUST_07836 [Providencia rustigianii DSM 4541]|uniref:Uncharacterized protein n=1 Tax=Providencia rustigianii DSM 4541 TaxID=500637 RepID=D1P6N4_9GAMM|nr:hypothetical protein PROVRUST_07836 [Providencia rustigianii DSM 4541]